MDFNVRSVDNTADQDILLGDLIGCWGRTVKNLKRVPGNASVIQTSRKEQSTQQLFDCA
jgi:hypothetical protein